MTQRGKIQSSQTGTDDNIIQRQKDARIQTYTHNFFNIIHFMYNYIIFTKNHS